MAARRAPPFTGRARECEAFDRMLDAARGGQSAVLVIRGEAGIGKTALMNDCARRASDCRVAQIAGVESELNMPFAALHQLCGPMLSDLEALPEPQERAVQVAFGVAAGNAPDRFLLGLAVLGLLTEAATKQPLVCLVDDAQWLDDASAQVLAFVGRRLLAEAVVLVFAVRQEADERLFPDLPTLTIEGLADEDARALLREAVPGQLDERVRDRIVAETRGNPLALLELPRAMSRAELAGGFAVPATARLPGRLQDHYRQRVEALPERTQRLTLLAAADPTGDAALLWRAAQALGIGREAAALADSEELLEVGHQVRFRHPLVRSAAYAAGTPADRRATHLALAAATDAEADPDRRVWHLAAAATGPDEDVASQLEQTAATVQARAGVASAAALLERSAALTPDPRRRVDRALAAVLANMHAGAFDAALGLLAQTEAAAVDDLQRARVEQLRAQIGWTSHPGRDLPVVLVQAAKRLEPLDVRLARETYLHAWLASTVAGPVAGPGGDLLAVSRAALSAPPPPHDPRPCDLLLDALAMVVVEGRAAAAPTLRRAVRPFLSDQASADEWLQWGHLATSAAMALWDVDSWLLLSTRQVEHARASGALSALSIALNARGMVATWCGDFEAATSMAAEMYAIHDVTGAQFAPNCDLVLAGYQGRLAEAVPLLSARVTDSIALGQGFAAAMANWATSVLFNSLGRYEDALTAAEQASDDALLSTHTQLVLPELIEGAVRSGEVALAEDSLRRLSTLTLGGSDWSSGIEARCRALVTRDPAAERWYGEAIDRLGRTALRPELARAHLLYGEWLRRENRRVDARQQLRAAYEMFAAMGAEAFAERTRRELVATGEHVRKREVDTRYDLTAQEEHIARLARDGRTNSEIGAELFLSTRTVEWHLGKVFTKLSITSRRGLHDALPRLDR